jgi:hypothetical protein
MYAGRNSASATTCDEEEMGREVGADMRGLGNYGVGHKAAATVPGSGELIRG